MKESIPKEHLQGIEEIIQMIVVMIIGHIEIEDSPMKEDGHQMKEGIPTEIEDLQEEEGSQDNGRLPNGREDTLVEEDHLMEKDLMEEDHLMMEGHLMEDPQDVVIEEDPQDLEDHLDQ